jgi:UPF0755 protein
VRGRARLYFTFAAVLVAIMGTGALAGYRYVDGQVHNPRPGTGNVTVVIDPGTPLPKIGEKLRSAGLIDNPTVFELYVRLGGHRVQAGRYVIARPTTMASVVALLEHNQAAKQVSVTVPEGFTAKQIGALLQGKGMFSADAYLSAQTGGTWSQDFLAGRPAGSILEGYLFPDTYFFAPEATPQEVIDAQLKRFGEMVPAQKRGLADAHGVTFAQAVVLASMVEREAKLDSDRAQIAAVFYNRLANGMALEVDATVLYAQGRISGDITDADKKVNSPENTYLHVGVPPLAISNPGIKSIDAVLTPASNNYLYYITDSAGRAHFSRTFPEHERCRTVNIDLCPTAP